jgi:two-component sensor histidine kinase
MPKPSDGSETEARIAKLEQTVRELRTRIAEIHHRTRNNLQLASSLVALAEAEGSDLDVADLGRRLQTISMVHNQLSPVKLDGEVTLDEFLVPIAKAIALSLSPPGLRVSLRTKVSPAALPLRRATSVGLIVNELMTNSIKHGFRDRNRGVIEIAATIADGVLEMSYRDDGIGLGGDGESTGGSGSRLLADLIDQLSGSFHRADCEPGFSAEIRIPLTLPTLPEET